jgi:hypothetical protein
MWNAINGYKDYRYSSDRLYVLIEHICYNNANVIQSQTETICTLTSEECRPASRIAAP